MEDELVKLSKPDILEALGWLEGAILCKKWNWSPDQHGYAIDAYNRLAEKLGLERLYKQN